MSSFRGYFQGLKNTVPTAISQIIEQIFNAIFSVLLAYFLVKQGEEMGAAGGTLGTGIGALSGLLVIIFIYYLARPVLLKKVANDKSKTQESSQKIATELLRVAVPIILGTAIFSMTNLIDLKMVKSILLGSGLSVDRVDELYGMLSGKYVVLTTLPVSISTALATAAIPSIASSVSLKETDIVNKKINTALRITMILSIPAAVGIGVLGDQILLLLFPNYPEGGIFLKVGSVSIVFLALAQITTGMLQGIGKVKVPAFAALCGAVIKIPLNILFISITEINVLGAIISTTICYLVASCIDLYYLVKYTEVMPDFIGIILKPFLSSIIMGLSCYTFYHFIFIFTASNSLAILVSIAIGVITYFAMLLLLKGLNKDDINLIPMGDKLVKGLEKINAI
jgi:stage V sporulation protein B